MPDIKETEEIHKESLVLLKHFHKLCVDNDIQYSLHGGTLLGAIRDGGFIPWDDDIDVTMTRDYFNKFLKLMQRTTLEDGYAFDTFGSSFYKFYSQREGKPLVWIDLFVWDYISEKRYIQKFKIALLAFFKAFCKSPTKLKETQEESHYSVLNIFGITIISLFGFFVPNKIKNAWVDSVRRRYGGKKEYVHRANDQFKGIKLILPKYVVSEYIDIPFENITLRASKYWKEILESTYGDDYMIPKKENNDIELHMRFRKRNELLRKD